MPLRLSAGTAANAVAWAFFAVLIAVAVVVAMLLGFVGLALLGGLTCLVCLRAEMDQDAPTWGTEVFKARMGGQKVSPEQRAASHDERRAFLSPLRFYRWCGVVLVAAGIAGFVWQQWGTGHG